MHIRLSGPTGELELVPWHEVSVQAVDAARIRALLSRDPGNRAALKRLIDAVAPGNSADLDDEALCHHVARLIERGLIQTRLIRAAAQPSETLVRLESVAPVPVPLEPEEDHWIEVLVVGEDDEALVGIECAITLPDGKVVRRKTNRDGLVRLEGISNPGQCDISFPALDAEAWESL